MHTQDATQASEHSGMEIEMLLVRPVASQWGPLQRHGMHDDSRPETKHIMVGDRGRQHTWST